jgi:hypothetical protein
MRRASGPFSYMAADATQLKSLLGEQAPEPDTATA